MNAPLGSTIFGCCIVVFDAQGSKKSAAKGLPCSRRLAGRPAEIPSTQQMQVQVKYGLTCAAAVVKNCAITGEQVALPGEFRGHELQLAQQWLVGMLGVMQR